MPVPASHKSENDSCYGKYSCNPMAAPLNLKLLLHIPGSLESQPKGYYSGP